MYLDREQTNITRVFLHTDPHIIWIGHLFIQGLVLHHRRDVFTKGKRAYCRTACALILVIAVIVFGLHVIYCG